MVFVSVVALDADRGGPSVLRSPQLPSRWVVGFSCFVTSNGRQSSSPRIDELARRPQDGTYGRGALARPVDPQVSRHRVVVVVSCWWWAPEGAGRRRLARELRISEHQARELLAAKRDGVRRDRLGHLDADGRV